MTIRRRELPGGGFDLVLDSACVSYITLTVRLEFGIRDATRDTLKVVISTPFCVGETEGDLSAPIDPEKDDPRIGELILRLRHKILTESHADPDGTLRLRFDNGVVIVVGPDPQYEAWDIDHSDFKVVSAAGGELSIWEQ